MYLTHMVRLLNYSALEACSELTRPCFGGPNEGRPERWCPFGSHKPSSRNVPSGISHQWLQIGPRGYWSLFATMWQDSTHHHVLFLLNPKHTECILCNAQSRPNQHKLGQDQKQTFSALALMEMRRPTNYSWS